MSVPKSLQATSWQKNEYFNIAEPTSRSLSLGAADVAFGSILLQKSNIAQPQNSHESCSLDFSAAASLFNAATEVGDRFWMKRYGPLRRRA
jgi:hypothetical protein